MARLVNYMNILVGNIIRKFWLKKLFENLAVPITDMQITLPPSLIFDQPFMDDGECALWYGKNNKILQFLFFGLWKH